MLGEAVYGVTMFTIIIINIYLRMITTQPVSITGQK
jgi:hypothetical protein